MNSQHRHIHFSVLHFFIYSMFWISSQTYGMQQFDYELGFFFFRILYTLLIPFGKFVFVTQRNCVATAPLMPQQTSTFESHFLTHMQGVAGAYHKLIACSWVPILQVGGLGKVRVNCFPKAITTWLGWDPESDALTTLPRCPFRFLF